MPILDQNGRPYPTHPRRPVDLPKLAKIQQPGQRWAVSHGRLTPEKLYRWLSAAALGDNEAYLTLAVEMEEKHLHYASQIQTRKLAVAGEEVEVLPGDDSERGQAIADEFRETVVEQEGFADFLLELLDGIAKGYAVVQPHWDTTRRPWAPREYETCDQRLFTFDRATLKELRLRDDASPDGQPLPRGLVVHTPKIRTGVVCRGGIARPAATGYLFSITTLAQWSTFAEVFGMPLRLGKYDPETATAEELDELRTALINFGHDAAAMVPYGMEIEFPDARRPTSGDNVYKEIVEYWDHSLSKLILGQTMTSDSTGRRGAQAEVHNDVRLDLKRADARSLCETLRRDIATPWTLWNHGEGAPVPRLKIAVDPPEDLEALSKALAPLIGVGLRVRAQEVRDKFGFSAPADSDESEVIEAPAPKVAVGPDGEIPEPKAPPARRRPASRRR